MVTCSQCKAQNPPDSDTCEHCQADLLPSPSPSARARDVSRAAGLGLLLVAIGVAPLFFSRTTFGIDIISGLSILVILVGLVLLARGLIRAIRPAPLYARYLDRAARHAQLDPDQAVLDFIHGAMLAPPRERPSISKRLPKKLRAVIAASDYVRLAAPGGYESTEGIRRIVYSAYAAWARLSEPIPELGQSADLGGEAGTLRANSDRKRRQILGSLGKLLDELAADGLVKPLGYCTRCKAVVACDDRDRCSCDPKHGPARGVVYVVPADEAFFTRRLQQAYAGGQEGRP